MIYTSYYANIKNLPQDMTFVSISGDGGNIVKFDGACYKTLAPKWGFWKQWHDNIGKVSEEENNSFYIEEFNKQVLKGLSQEEVARDLRAKFGENVVLLCYEKPDEFCHRHIVGEWFRRAQIPVEEFSLQKYRKSMKC